jgi:hypothetical protein
MKPPVLLFAIAVSAAGQLLATPQSWTGNPARGAEELEQQWKVLSPPASSLSIRGVFRFALEASALNWHPERVEVALHRARAMQDLDRASKTYGNFKWRGEHERVFDLNAVEFAMQIAGLLRARYAAALSPESHRQLDEIMDAAVAGLREHEVKIEYTNIFVMKAWDLIASGESLGRMDVAADGYRRLDQWLRFTARNGISEYGAVTYYGIDLDSLALIARFARRPEGRAQAELAMRYLWTDISANWWAAGDRLGGANSRSYDYLFGHGYLEAHTWTAGWLRVRPELEGAGWLGNKSRFNLSALYDDCTWLPPAEVTDPLRAQLPRVVVQRWGKDSGHRAIAYIGDHVSIASAGASHGDDERTLVANLGDSPALPQLVLFMDGRGDPFGTKKTANAASQAKALHLTPFIATVQRGAEVLQVLSDDPLGPGSQHQPGELACFLTHLTLPAKAEIWFGETHVQPGPPENPTLAPPGTPIFVRVGDAVLAVRFLLAQSVTGDTLPVQFITDGARAPAHRLTIAHSAAEPKGRGTVAVLMRAAEGLNDEAFTAFRKTFTELHATAQLAGGVLTADAAGKNGPLHIEADVIHGARRMLTGGEPEALLSVNGRDLGREMLAKFIDE